MEKLHFNVSFINVTFKFLMLCEYFDFESNSILKDFNVTLALIYFNSKESVNFSYVKLKKTITLWLFEINTLVWMSSSFPYDALQSSQTLLMHSLHILKYSFSSSNFLKQTINHTRDQIIIILHYKLLQKLFFKYFCDKK